MKALYFSAHGERDHLEYGDLPDPTPGPGEALVEIRAAALNHLDIWVRRGWPGLKLALPHVGGSDGAGVIAAFGPDTATGGLEIGRRVVIDPGITTAADEWTRRGLDSLSPGYEILGEHRAGTLAERIAVPVVNLLPIPDGFGFAEAAAPLLCGLTAWRMLIVAGEIRAGETVLIVGASGGVNSLAIQLAKLTGARVVALTSSPEKMARARELGADEVIDYRAEPEWAKAIYKLTGRRGVDVVVDNVGQATLAASIRALAPGGRLLTVGNTSGFKVEFDIRTMFAKQIRWIGTTMGSHQDFRDVMDLVWSGKLRPVIDRVLPLAAGREAVRLLEEGRQFGKVVLEP
jgi:NADPH:quinone reductase-like Zn-dependent oxidoreductase